MANFHELRQSILEAERKLGMTKAAQQQQQQQSETAARRRILKSRQELEEETRRQAEEEERKAKEAARRARPPSPGRLEELAASRSRYYSELRRKKEEEEARLRSNIKLSTTEQQEKACERLYKEHQRKNERLIRLKTEISIHENAENRPPVITPFAKRVTSTPIYERTNSILEQKSQKINRLRISLAESDRSMCSQVSRADPEAITARLLANAEMLKAKKEAERQALLELEKPRGRPSIDKKSREIVERTFIPGTTFLDRQEEELRLRKEREARLQAEAHARQSVAKKVLSPRSAQRVIEKLYVDDQNRMFDSREKVVQEYVSQFTFKPSIDQRSKALKPKGSGGLDELYRNSQGSKKKQESAKRIEEERLKECTFHPLLNTYWSDQGKENVEAIRAKKEEKAEKVRQAKWEQEMREAQECTFTPKIITNKKRPSLSPSLPASQLVKGLDSFLERKKQAEALKEEQRRREEKVFLEKLPPLKNRGSRLLETSMSSTLYY